MFSSLKENQKKSKTYGILGIDSIDDPSYQQYQMMY